MSDFSINDFVFRTTSDGILAADHDGNIQRVNPAAAAMLGITLEETVGKSASDVFQQNPNPLNLFTRAGEQTLNVRLPMQHMAIGVASTDENDTRIILLQDVTEKQQLESRRGALVT